MSPCSWCKASKVLVALTDLVHRQPGNPQKSLSPASQAQAVQIPTSKVLGNLSDRLPRNSYQFLYSQRLLYHSARWVLPDRFDAQQEKSRRQTTQPFLKSHSRLMVYLCLEKITGHSPLWVHVEIQARSNPSYRL